MKSSFSDQLRQAVRDCGTTRYALSKQLGISESALSRFLSGERGLTLDTLDKLADALGLQVVAAVQATRRPSQRGPKKRKEPKVVAAIGKSATIWDAVARESAKDANENCFSSRRGIWSFSDHKGVFCLYNNNPYAHDPGLRDKETAKFRAWLKEKGIRELAYATYPESGQDAGYTYAILIAADESQEAEIVAAMRNIVRESWERLGASSS